MTLDEFREHTKDMRGDVEIMYHHASGYHPVNTFRVLDDNNLVLCHKIYGQEDYLGILEAKVFLHKKEERK